MLRTDFDDVRLFHVRFGLPFDHPNSFPAPLRADILEFRLGFLNEECAEFAEAYGEDDLVKIVDSLLDFVYVAIGTMLFMGVGLHNFGLSWPAFQKTSILATPPFNRPRFPHKLGFHMQEAIHARMSNEVRLFKLCHQAVVMDDYPLQYATSCLSGATETAYFAAHLMGIPWDACWKHVQRANMEKVRAESDGSNSKRQSSWDVVKPTGWTPPDPHIRNELILAGATLEK